MQNEKKQMIKYEWEKLSSFQQIMLILFILDSGLVLGLGLATLIMTMFGG